MLFRSMIAPILKSKAERKALEKAAEERIKAKRRRNKILAIFALGALIFTIVFSIGVYMFNQNRELDKALKKAQESEEKAVAALTKMEAAQIAKELSEFEKVLNYALQISKSTGNCPPILMRNNIDSMKNKYPNNIKLQKQINDVLIKLTNCK